MLSLVWLIAGSFLAADRPPPQLFTAPAGEVDPVLPADRAPAHPRMVFLGDSWGEGAGSERSGGGLADQVALAQGWRLINASRGGTGYVTGLPSGSSDSAPLPDRVVTVVAKAPDVVIVAAGFSDAARGYTEERIRDGVERTLRSLRAQLPEAAVYVIGPFWNNGYPADSALLVDQVVAETAAALELPYISPIAQRWITGSRMRADPGNGVAYIGPESTNPSQSGHDLLAGLITDWLASVAVSSRQ